MRKQTLIKKARNSKGYWRLIAVHNSSKGSYYVNHFSLNGNLTSNSFKSFAQADQYFNSQTKKRGSK